MPCDFVNSLFLQCAACKCIHVRACLAQFVADGVEDESQSNMEIWQRSLDRHAGKLFKSDRKPAVQAILDHCISFDTQPVVAGRCVVCLSRYRLFLFDPSFTDDDNDPSFWSVQCLGVHHYAKFERCVVSLDSGSKGLHCQCTEFEKCE